MPADAIQPIHEILNGLTVQVPLPAGPVQRRDRLGGIIHEYGRAA